MSSLYWLAALITAVALAAAAFYSRLVDSLTGNLGKRETNPTTGLPGEEIYLHAMFIPVLGCRGTKSPYTTKIEAFLRLNGLKYTCKTTKVAQSPNGRFPWMCYGGQVVSDSRFIIRFLQNTYGSELKTHEPDEAVGRGLSTLIQRLCEEHIYFTNLYHSAATPEGRREAPKLFKKFAPWPMYEILAMAWAQGRTTKLRYQGVLTNSHKEINALVEDDLATLAAMLADKPFFLGSQPSAADATVFGFLEANTHGPLNPVGKIARQHQNLVQFVERIQQQYFADRPDGFQVSALQ